MTEPDAKQYERKVTATAVYRALILECERRRIALGFPMEKFDEYAGLPERYYAKALHPDQRSGRQAQWSTMQLIVDALFPTGFDIEIRAKPGAPTDYESLKAKLLQLRATVDPRTQRDLMRELGRRGAERAAQVKRERKPGKERRKAAAKHAARMRWQTPQIVEITGNRGNSGA